MTWFRQFFKKRIFLDYASATPVLWRVQWAMWRYLWWDFYNPNAIYAEGVRVRERVEQYRAQIARLLGVAKDSIIFTSGGTEANVLAVRGVRLGKVVVEPESHPSVLEAVRKSRSREVTLVSSVTTDNQLGRKIREKRQKSHSEYPLLHIDASQSAPYHRVGLEALACDILTLDSAKLGGPKGIGALVVRKGVKLDLPPRGTPPVPLIAGFTKALELAIQEREEEYARLNTLSGKLAEALQKAFPQAMVARHLPNVVNFSLPTVLPELVVLALDRAGVLASAGPACEAHKPEPPETPVRFSLGRRTSEKDIKEAIKIFCLAVEKMLK